MLGLSHQPVEAGEAARLLAGLRREAGVDMAIVMLSGGPDSVALTGLAAQVSRSTGLADFIAVTVDHGLRAASRGEAEAAGRFARLQGLQHEILNWSGLKPRSGIQAAAREARYRLVQDYARSIGASAIVTAHTLDDQAETVLMRLTHGSGMRGLAGMGPTGEQDGLLLLRPFLAIPKARLIATCQAQGWAFADDPSNSNPAFLRARLRKLAPVLAQEGLTAARLAVLANRLRRADQALEARTQAVLQQAARGAYGYDAAAIVAEPEEIVVRLFGALLDKARADNASLPPPRLERIERLAGDFRQAVRDGSSFSRTLGGLQFVIRGGVLCHSAEPPRRAVRLRQNAAISRALLGNRASPP